MNTLTVTLKQHTPLIHFQHDQEGATLRASEVKPKLDRFILTKLGNGDYGKGKTEAKKSGLTIGGQETALDYKMKFIVNEAPEIFYNNEVQKDRQGNAQTVIRKDGRIIKKLKPYPLFFANLNTNIDNPLEYKCFSMLHKPFEMKLQSFNKDLLDQIEKQTINLGQFFQYTNFGTRQSKGFGSFYIEENDKLHEDIEDLKYRFSVDVRSESKKWLDLFTAIDLFYKSLRSGINICWGDKFYMKPAIFQYAKDRNYDWDKKLIKDFFFNNNSPKQQNDFLFKDLLGLSSEESWMSYGTNISKEHSTSDIKRFQSPIIIKPILRDGYFDVFVDANPNAKELFEKYCGQVFNIIRSKNPEEKLKLKTFPNFDINDFLEFALLKNDIGRLTTGINHEKFLELTNIYNEIKKEHE